MRAPVYRNIEAQSTLLGLAFPTEVAVVLGSFWGSMLLLPAGLALLATAAVYTAVRVVGYGRPPLFLQHYLAWRLRGLLGGGRLSAAARSPAPQFPFGARSFRDLPARVGRQVLVVGRQRQLPSTEAVTSTVTGTATATETDPDPVTVPVTDTES